MEFPLSAVCGRSWLPMLRVDDLQGLGVEAAAAAASLKGFGHGAARRLGLTPAHHVIIPAISHDHLTTARAFAPRAVQSL